jgi:transporter family-2 protein
MKIFFSLCTAALGAAVALHLIMNAAVGRTSDLPRLGNAVFWVIGALVAVALALPGLENGALTKITKVPWWLWFAGALGAFLMYSTVILIPRVGPGSFQILLLVGQIIFGMIVAHYGLLGFPVDKINIVRIAGVCVMVIGCYLAVIGKIPLLE